MAISASAAPASRRPAFAAGVLGFALGGFFDGILLHQVLQWHHMLTSAGYPPDSVDNLRINTVADGLFHASTYAFVAAGLAVLWRSARRTHLRWSGKLLVGTLLMGFGLFNLVEGLVDHHLLAIHHVNETVPREQWVDGVPPANLATTVPGVFAAGDIRAGSMKRVAAASGEGASVVPLVHAFLAPAGEAEAVGAPVG